MLCLSVFFTITYFSIRASLISRSEEEVREQLRHVLVDLKPGMDAIALRHLLATHEMTMESRIHFVLFERRVGALLPIPIVQPDSVRLPDAALKRMLTSPGETVGFTDGVGSFRLVSLRRGAFLAGAAINTIFIEEAEDSMVQAFAYSLLLGLLFAVVSGIVVANFTVSPLSALAKSAQEIAAASSVSATRLPVTTNITEIRELVHSINSLLEARDASLDQMRNFTADAAHELRTPLTVLKGEIEVELRLLPIGSEQREVLESNLEEVERLISIVQDLLYLATMEGVTDREVDVEPCDLGACVERAIQRLVAMAEKKKIQIQAHIEHVEIAADEERIIRLTYNVLLNAVQHSSDGSRIEVSAVTVAGAGVVLTIVDSGCGIPAPDLPHIFDRFYRAGKSRSRAEGGAGLGLAIAKSIADHYGLVLGIESKVGEGTTVTLFLPSEIIHK